MPRVTITIPGNSPQAYSIALNQPLVTIGRHDGNDIVIGSGSVSGKHAELHRFMGAFHLIDVGSTNGIMLDNYYHQTLVLQSGMIAKIGDAEFGFILSEDESTALSSELNPNTTAVIVAEAERAQAELAQAERAQAERAQAELAQAELAQAELAQAERAQAERAQAERAQAERAQAELAQAELAQAERAQAELAQAELAQAELAQAERAQAERAQAERAQAELAQAERAQAELAQAELAQAELAQAELAQAELAQAELAQAELAQAERAQAELAQAERAQAELVQAERAKAESAKAELANAELEKAERAKAEHQASTLLETARKEEAQEKPISKTIENKEDKVAFANKDERLEKRVKAKRPVDWESRDEYYESKTLKIGSAAALFVLIVVATAFLYSGMTRESKGTGESPTKETATKDAGKDETNMESGTEAEKTSVEDAK